MVEKYLNPIDQLQERATKRKCRVMVQQCMQVCLLST